MTTHASAHTRKMHVSHHIIAALFAYAENRGLSREQVLAVGKLSQRQLHSHDERVPAETLYAVHHAIDQLTGDPAWALGVAEALSKGA